MTWRQRTVCRILLLVARIVAGDADLERRLEHLANHIDVHGTQADKEPE